MKKSNFFENTQIIQKIVFFFFFRTVLFLWKQSNSFWKLKRNMQIKIMPTSGSSRYGETFSTFLWKVSRDHNQVRQKYGNGGMSSDNNRTILEQKFASVCWDSSGRYIVWEMTFLTTSLQSLSTLITCAVSMVFKLRGCLALISILSISLFSHQPCR